MPPPSRILGVRNEVFWLGVVSFVTDLSSEMIFSVFSVFLSAVLGASAVTIGLMEGLADFAASSLDWVSGYFSDRTGRRKPFVVSGYGFSAAAKAILVVAGSVPLAFAFRVVERLGKSVRGAPRDALLASFSEKNRAGYSFGLHKAMDKLGAVLGPLVAYFLLSLLGQTRESFSFLFTIAAVLAWLAVLVLGLSVRESKERSPALQAGFLAAYRSLGPPFRRYLGVAALFSLGYFGFAFLLLKAYQVGFQIKQIALLYACFNSASVLSSIPLGRLGDRIGRRSVIAGGYLLYGILCLGFAFATTKLVTVAWFLAYGVFFSIDEGQTRAYIADLADSQSVGSALGLYSFVTGLAYLPASLLAGVLWKAFGPPASFAFGAGVAMVSLLAFLVLTRRDSRDAS